jgi:L-serine deaminase
MGGLDPGGTVIESVVFTYRREQKFAGNFPSDVTSEYSWCSLVKPRLKFTAQERGKQAEVGSATRAAAGAAVGATTGATAGAIKRLRGSS